MRPWKQVILTGMLVACAVCVPAGAAAQDEIEILRVDVKPEQPTLLDEVTVVARVVAVFGQEVRFEMDAPDPAVWRPLSGSEPGIETRWHGGLVEHVAAWRLLPLMPGDAPLPEVRASRESAAGAASGNWRVQGQTVRVAVPPGADRGAGQALTDVQAELPTGGGGAMALVFLVLGFGLTVFLVVLHRSSRSRLADPVSPQRQLAELLAELGQERLQGAHPTRGQVMAWRRALPGLAGCPVPDGLLAQADALLYQADDFDARTASTWARDVRRWLVTLQTQGKPAQT